MWRRKCVTVNSMVQLGTIIDYNQTLLNNITGGWWGQQGRECCVCVLGGGIGVIQLNPNLC